MLTGQKLSIISWLGAWRQAGGHGAREELRVLLFFFFAFLQPISTWFWGTKREYFRGVLELRRKLVR